MSHTGQSAFVDYTEKDGVATITLNRPDAMNALHREMLADLADAVKRVSASQSARIVVLRGNGGVFCAGGDIKFMTTAGNDRESFFALMDLIASIATGLYTMPKLCVAAVHGAAAGLGLSIALAADRVIAHRASKIAMNFAGIGLVPDGGGHFHMSRRLGEAKAKEIIWAAEVLSAEQAFECGLVDELADDHDSAVSALVESWSRKPLQALIRSKLILAETQRPVLEHILELEKQGQYAMRQTADHAEGIKAFVEKRKPSFRGE